MKIAVWHNLTSGGGKRALYDHVKGLLDRGHTVECWCPPTADRSYLPLGELTKEHVRPLDWTKFPERPWSASLAMARTLLRRLAAMERHCRQCATEMEDRGFDVIFANSCIFFRVPAIARHTTLPTVLYLQEPYRWLYEALPQLPWIAEIPKPRGPFSGRRLVAPLTDYIRLRALRIQAREELLGAEACTSILVNSFFSRESVLRAYGLDARVCYLGIDTRLFVDRGLPREPFVLGVGSFTPEKRIDFVIRALAGLPPRQRRLVWVGNIAHATYFAEIKALAASLGVSFEPRLAVPDDEVLDLLNRASVMAYAPRLEPFGLAPLEANACGLPVVAVAEGGVRESVVHGHNGLLCDAEPEAMGAAIASLLDDPARAQALGRSARAVAAERWPLSAAVGRLEHQLLSAYASQRRASRRDVAVPLVPSPEPRPATAESAR